MCCDGLRRVDAADQSPFGFVFLHGLFVEYDGLPVRRNGSLPTDWKFVVQCQLNHNLNV